MTLGCLANLSEAGVFEHCEVVVVDDGSTDGTAAAVARQFPNVHLLEGKGDLWWTGAISMGMQFAYARGATELVWLNDDCRVGRRSIFELVKFVQEHNLTIAGAQSTSGENVMFGGKRRAWTGFKWIGPVHAMERCDLVSGNLVCFPREAVERVGYPDVNATPHYGGDTLYLIRCANNGFSIYVRPDPEALDVGDKSDLMPENWLQAPGAPSALLKLAFNPRSGLSWKVWWHLNLEAYGAWGVLLFAKKYAAIGAATLLRVVTSNSRDN